MNDKKALITAFKILDAWIFDNNMDDGYDGEVLNRLYKLIAKHLKVDTSEYGTVKMIRRHAIDRSNLKVDE